MANAVQEETKSSDLESEFLIIDPVRLEEDDPRGDLLIHLKSKVLEDFFTGICPDKEKIKSGKMKECCLIMTKAKNKDNAPIYLMKLDKTIKGMTGKYDELFFTENYSVPNMSMLLAIGLGEGVDFIFKGMYTEKTVNDTLLNLYRRALDIYNEYARPLSLKIKVIIEGERRI